jgi:hypothetical protein
MGTNDPQAPSQDTAPLSPEQRLAKLFQGVVALVRVHIRDHSLLNRLVKGQEHSDRTIALAILQCIDRYNAKPPLLPSRSIKDFPSVDLLIRGTVAILLFSTGILQTRNRMVYSDGMGTRVNMTENPQLNMQWAQVYQQTWDRDVRELKQALNLDASFQGTGIISEYLLINGMWDI